MSSFFTSTKNENIEKLALGCFDGFHLGHLELFKHLKPENSAILVIDKFQNERLLPRENMQKMSKFEIIFVEFEKIKDLEASEFLRLLKENFTNLHTLIVGYDFKFGKNRSAKAADIELLSEFKAIIVPEFSLNFTPVHSKFIKEMLSNGDFSTANALLGREYAIEGSQISGQGLGGKKLVPTINLDTKSYFLPKNGVMACVCEVKKREFKAVCFIGQRGTDGKFSVEVHILDENFANLKVSKNETFRLIFKKFLRENQKFSDLNALKSQILKDCTAAKAYLKDIL